MVLGLGSPTSKMKNIFYLTFLEGKLEQKCSVKQFAKCFVRPSAPSTFLTLDSGSYMSPNRLVKSKKKHFFGTEFAIKIRFSRDLFLQSFLLSHQKTYINFAQKYKESFKMLQNINFCVLLILRSKRGGFLVRVAGFICFLPKSHYRRLFSRIAAAHFATSIKYQLRNLLLFLLKVCFKIKADFNTFALLCEKVSFGFVLKRKVVLNKALLSSKLPFKQRLVRGLPSGKRGKLLFSFKLSASYLRKKFLKKRRVWNGRAKFILCFQKLKKKPKKKNAKKLPENSKSFKRSILATALYCR